MLFACNYSDELAELLKEGIVHVDYIKLGLFELYKGVLEKAISIKPVLLHGLGFNERASMKNINEVNWEYANKTNAELLLDIAHAKVTAKNSHESVYDYLNRLPLNKVKEIHIVGTAEKENVELRDWHLEMKEEDYEILQWTLLKSKPDIVTLEYGGPGEVFSWRSDKEALKRQLIRLIEICKNLA